MTKHVRHSLNRTHNQKNSQHSETRYSSIASIRREAICLCSITYTLLSNVICVHKLTHQPRQRLSFRLQKNIIYRFSLYSNQNSNYSDKIQANSSDKNDRR